MDNAENSNPPIAADKKPAGVSVKRMVRAAPIKSAVQTTGRQADGASPLSSTQSKYDAKADAIALALYDSRLRSGESTPALFLGLAKVLSRTGKPEEALTVFKKLSEELKVQLASQNQDPALIRLFVDVMFAASETHQRLGDTSAAVQALAHVRGLADDSVLEMRLAELSRGALESAENTRYEKLTGGGCLEGIDGRGCLKGWATRSDKPQGSLNVYFFLNDRLVGSDCTRLDRPDLLKAGQACEKSGFSMLPDLSVLAPDLRVGATLRAAFDLEGRYALSGSVVLAKSDIQRLEQGTVDAVFTGELQLSMDEAIEKIRYFKTVGLGGVQLFRELMVGVLKSLLADGNADQVLQYFARPDGLTSMETSAPLLEFELVRCMAAVDHENTDLISIERLNAAFVSCYGDEAFRKGGHRERQRIQTLLSLLRLHLLFSLSFSPAVINEPLQNTLCKTLSHWAHRLVGDDRLSLDFLDLLAFKNQVAPDTFSAQEVRLNNALGRSQLALGIAVTAIRQGDTSWYVYHEAGVILRAILKSCPQYYGKFAAALMGLFQQAMALNPEQSLSVFEAREFLQTWFDASMEATAALAFRGNIAAAIAKRTDAIRNISTRVQHFYGAPVPVASSGHAPGKNVLFLGSRELFQCFYYRVQQKMDQAEALGIAHQYLDIAALKTPSWPDRLMNVGVVFACRVPATLEILCFFAYARSLGIKIVYDIDDLIFNPDHFPPPLASYAGTISADTHVHLAMDNPFFSEALAYADHCTTSTKPLAEQLRAFVPAQASITVWPNLMSGELHALAQSVPQARSPSGRFVLFYGSATKAHKQVFYEVLLPAALYVLKHHDHVDLHLVGYFENLPLQWLKNGRIRLYQPTPEYMSYLKWVSQADVNLAPLEASVVTDTKSEIKWLEAAVFGIPSVVSPTATYQNVLIENEHVLFADTALAWASQLECLVKDASLRQRIGQAAKAHALANYVPGVGESIFSGVLSSMGFSKKSQAKKRILFANVFYAPQSIGGATRVVEAQVKGLLQHYGDAFEVHVLTTHSSPDAGRPYGVDQFYSGGALVTRLHVPLKDWTVAEDEKVEEFCRDFFAQYDFDLLHLHSVQVLTASVAKAALSKNIPYVITLHDAWWLSPYMFLVDENAAVVDPKDLLSGGVLTVESSSKRLHRAHLLRDVMGKASALLAVSEKFAQVYRNAGVANVTVHENVSQPFIALPRAARDADKTVLGFIGGMSSHKGYHLFKAALQSGDFPNFKALVVDHGLEPGEPAYHARWGSTDVEFIAKTPQAEVAELYARMDVLVAPSIWPESYGLVTREAAQAGVWVIASDQGAIGDCVVEGVNGNVVEVSDFKALQKVLLGLNRKLLRSETPDQKGSLTGATLNNYGRALVQCYAVVLGQN